MENTFLIEAKKKYPDTVSNYEALDLLASEVHRKLIKLDIKDDNFLELRNKYFAIIKLRNCLPVGLTIKLSA